MEERNRSNRSKKSKGEKERKRGNKYFAKGKYPKAMEAYFESLKNLPHDIRTLNNMALVSLRMGNVEDSIDFCERSLLIDPSNPKVRERRYNIIVQRC